jgi:hypothetical protein
MKAPRQLSPSGTQSAPMKCAAGAWAILNIVARYHPRQAWALLRLRPNTAKIAMAAPRKAPTPLGIASVGARRE